MASKITEEMLDNIFVHWVNEGVRVGALDKKCIYALEDGGAYTTFAVTILDDKGRRARFGSSTVPNMGKVRGSAYKTLEIMLAAWRMVP